MIVLDATPGGSLPGLVPVHVDHHDVDGDLPLAELAAECQKFVVGIRPVTAPPIAEGIFGRHRNASRHFREVRQGGLVVVAIRKQVEVLHLPFSARFHPLAPVAVVIHEQMPPALVHNGPAVAREDARFHRVRIIDMVGAGAAIQRAGCAHQVAVCRQAGMPDHRLPVQFETGLQIVGRERPALVDQGQRAGRDGDAVADAFDSITRHGQPAVDDRQGGVVFELGFRRPFHADQAVRQDREAGIPRHDLGGGIGYGIVLGKSRADHRQQQGGYKELLHNQYFNL